MGYHRYQCKNINLILYRNHKRLKTIVIYSYLTYKYKIDCIINKLFLY
nr:MAG TPA: hypothetical protein [Crassvirales sp.]